MPIVIPGYENEEDRPSFFGFHDNTYNIILRVAYLIGVPKKFFDDPGFTPEPEVSRLENNAGYA